MERSAGQVGDLQTSMPFCLRSRYIRDAASLSGTDRDGERVHRNRDINILDCVAWSLIFWTMIIDHLNRFDLVTVGQELFSLLVACSCLTEIPLTEAFQDSVWCKKCISFLDEVLNVLPDLIEDH